MRTYEAIANQLRADVDARMPVVELPEALLEVHAWTGCLEKFTHVSEAQARATDLTTSLAAVLISQAMNVGMPPLVQDGTRRCRWTGCFGWSRTMSAPRH